MQSLHLQECFNVFCCFFFLKRKKEINFLLQIQVIKHNAKG